MTHYENPTGLWVPLITPFKDGEIDGTSLQRLLNHYAQKDISGIILAATTGEGQLLSEQELKQLVHLSAETLVNTNSELPLYLGVSGSDAVKVVQQIKSTENWPLNGYLVSGPSYLRPSQEGVFKFFGAIANSTDKPIILYNIPYRTGINIENETMLRLAKISNIVGVKDCCGNVEQSYALLRTAPADFSVLTGEDPFFYNALVHGAPGAIVTGAHVLVDAHLDIIKLMKDVNHHEALEKWNSLAHVPKLLFAEPNPAPLKYWLWKEGLIDSAEVRSPFMPISTVLEGEIDAQIKQ